MTTRRIQFGHAPRRRRPLRIGLLNNMPDAALHATERQFARLLNAAAGGHEIDLRYYALPEIPRGEYTRTYMATLYGELEEMFELELDGLIVTGAETRAETLSDEPYWPRLAQVIDWAAANVPASYWSDLAAHAAVERLDGIGRVRLPAKCSGVFESRIVGEDPLLAHLRAPLRAPHARQNTLDEQALVEHGYGVLTRSDEAGVDLFVRRGRSVMLFCQGHPEYDADTLLQEYCRDAGRFLAGRSDDPPKTPSGYLSVRVRQALLTAARRGAAAGALARCNAVAAAAHPRNTWRAGAVTLFRNWLRQASAGRSRTARAARETRPPSPTQLEV